MDVTRRRHLDSLRLLEEGGSAVGQFDRRLVYLLRPRHVLLHLLLARLPAVVHQVDHIGAASARRRRQFVTGVALLEAFLETGPRVAVNRPQFGRLLPYDHAKGLINAVIDIYMVIESVTRVDLDFFIPAPLGISLARLRLIF